MKAVLTTVAIIAIAVISTSCVTIQGDTTYAGTYVSNQKDSKALNISGSNATQAIREAEGSGVKAATNADQNQGDQTARGAFAIVAGQSVSQSKQADVDAVAAMQQGNKAAGTAGNDSRTDGGGTNVAPVLNATGQGSASSGAANNAADKAADPERPKDNPTPSP